MIRARRLFQCLSPAIRLSIGLTVGLVIAGCGALGDQSNLGFEGSCTHPTYCDDYSDYAAGAVASERDRCPTVDIGAWSPTMQCSRRGVIGGCRYDNSGGAPGYRLEWYQPDWGPPQLARGTCEGFGGTWIQPDLPIK